ncbi:unnamed protein product, partial [Ectocarpus sp. 13 AM-2016]
IARLVRRPSPDEQPSSAVAAAIAAEKIGSAGITVVAEVALSGVVVVEKGRRTPKAGGPLTRGRGRPGGAALGAGVTVAEEKEARRAAEQEFLGVAGVAGAPASALLPSLAALELV